MKIEWLVIIGCETQAYHNGRNQKSNKWSVKKLSNDIYLGNFYGQEGKLKKALFIDIGRSLLGP
jgi:hypothetical protein